MHILLIHQIFVTPEEGGGTRHFELSKYLVKKGHQVTIIASDTDYLSGRKKLKKRDNMEGVETIYAKTYKTVHTNYLSRALSFMSFSLISFINAIKVRNVDIVWGTSPPLFQSLTALLISKLKRRPFIFEVRDLWVDFAEELGIVKNRHIIKIIKLFEKILYRSSQKIIVNSPGFIPFVRQYASAEKIALIPNGVITNDFELKENLNSTFRSKYGLKNKFIAIYLGNMGVANDIETILGASEDLKKYEDIVFVLMGGGMKKEYFKDYVLKKKISNVLILDSHPKSEIPRILSDVDICIATLKDIPLFRTTYPNKVFDYMAAQKPTVLAIDGAIRKVIEDSKGGIYVSPGNREELGRTVLKYYYNPDLKAEHGKNARDYVKQHFEREKIAGDLEKLCFSISYAGVRD